MKLPKQWPMCAVCLRPVEKIEEWWNPSTDEFTYTAYCHGDTETTTFSRSYFITGHELEGGRAFALARLENQPQPPHGAP